MNKFLPLFFFSFFSIFSYAAEIKINGLYFSLDKYRKTAEITYRGETPYSYKGEYKDVIDIPSKVSYKGTEYKVISIDECAFLGCEELLSVNIPNSVEYIGDSAFKNCINLMSVHFTNSVRTIGAMAFCNTKYLNAIHFKGTIYDYCTILMKSSISTAYDLFINGEKLLNLRIPDELESVNPYIFAGSNIVSLYIPYSINNIYDAAFANCKRLKEVKISSGVKYISYNAFYGNDSLKMVDFLGDLKDWCNIIFANDRANPTFCTHSLYINHQKIDVLNIPENVKEIKHYAFVNTDITEINLGSSVVSFMSTAIDGCTKLKKIVCKSYMPPAVYDHFQIDSDKLYLYVPKEVLLMYFDHPFWGKFTNITPIMEQESVWEE